MTSVSIESGSAGVKITSFPDGRVFTSYDAAYAAGLFAGVPRGGGGGPPLLRLPKRAAKPKVTSAAGTLRARVERLCIPNRSKWDRVRFKEQATELFRALLKLLERQEAGAPRAAAVVDICTALVSHGNHVDDSSWGYSDAPWKVAEFVERAAEAYAAGTASRVAEHRAADRRIFEDLVQQRFDEYVKAGKRRFQRLVELAAEPGAAAAAGAAEAAGPLAGKKRKRM